MFKVEMVETFIKNTNSFAVELKNFISICLYLGVVKFPYKLDT